MRRYIFKDPSSIDWNNPMESHALVVDSHGSKLMGALYTTQGEGPHPTILLLHGFPGHEKNLDLMQTLRRAGFNVAIFHYRGSWGSEGNFSFHNVLEDSKTIVRYLIQQSSNPDYRIDARKLILTGHSMGGFATLMTALEFPEIKYAISIAGWNLGVAGSQLQQGGDDGATLTEMFRECAIPLRGTSPEALITEAIENRHLWNLVARGLDFMPKSILLVAGTRDTICRRSMHHDRLAQAIRSHHGSSLTEMVLEDTHSFPHTRNALAEGILWWLENQGLAPDPDKKL